MKIHGYAKEEQDAENITPADLAEVTLVASPEELRRIAKFLELCANKIEIHEKSWEHEHLSDQDKSFEHSPHFIVFNPSYEL
ncbi:Imm32 family immunity protein [Aquipseudomonas campi]